MALEIFKLVGSIFVDNEKANESISKTDGKAQGVGETLLNGIGTAAKWGAAITSGAAAAGASLVAFAGNAASTCDTIDKMSQKIGISKEAYQELDYILGQNGIDVNILQTGMKTMVTQMQTTADGTSKTATAFEKLGIAVIDTNGQLKSQEDVFFETITALQGMENITERNALANKLFGKSATELAPLLNGGAESMEELRARAHDLGLVLSDETVTAGVVLGDTMDDVKKSFGSIVTKLGSSLMPVVQKVADYIIANLPKIQNLFAQMEPVITALFNELLPPLMDLAEQLFPTIMQLIMSLMPIVTEIIQSVLPVIVELLNMILPPVVEIVNALLPPLLGLLRPILDLLSPLIQLLQPILDLVVSILDPISTLITGLLTPLITIVTKVINFALVPLKNHFGFLADILSGTVKAAIDFIMSRFNTVKDILGGVIDFVKNVFTGNWKGAWDNIVGIFKSIWNGIVDTFKIPINWVIDGINAFLRGLNKIKIPDWVPLVGGKGFNIGEIPRLEEGAILERGQTGFLEGNGAEAVVPLHNNRKWINAVADDMDTAMGGTSGKRVESILIDILGTLEELLGLGIYLDTGALVGGLARPMDRKMGQIAAQKARA